MFFGEVYKELLRAVLRWYLIGPLAFDLGASLALHLQDARDGQDSRAGPWDGRDSQTTRRPVAARRRAYEQPCPLAAAGDRSDRRRRGHRGGTRSGRRSGGDGGAGGETAHRPGGSGRLGRTTLR